VRKLKPSEGQVERVNRTLQDRLVKELRLAAISDRETGILGGQKVKRQTGHSFATSAQ